jgi:hypothetical protein
LGFGLTLGLSFQFIFISQFFLVKKFIEVPIGCRLCEDSFSPHMSVKMCISYLLLFLLAAFTTAEPSGPKGITNPGAKILPSHVEMGTCAAAPPKPEDRRNDKTKVSFGTFNVANLFDGVSDPLPAQKFWRTKEAADFHMLKIVEQIRLVANFFSPFLSFSLFLLSFSFFFSLIVSPFSRFSFFPSFIHPSFPPSFHSFLSLFFRLLVSYFYLFPSFFYAVTHDEFRLAQQ